jgi:hypothetical protein
MSISTYRLSVPVFLRGLGILSHYLDKVEAYAEEKGIDANELVNARLAPDMLPLVGQYQRVTDTAKFAIGRLAGIETPRFEDTETTVSELRARLAKAEAFFATITPEVLEGTESREVKITIAKVERTMTGQEYLLTFALPNFYFHITTAHGILRNQGLPVGKMDYLGSFA